VTIIVTHDVADTAQVCAKGEVLGALWTVEFFVSEFTHAMSGLGQALFMQNLVMSWGLKLGLLTCLG
jgi:hypothetical protein